MAHSVLDERDAGRLDAVDVPEELKRLHARSGLPYDSRRIAKLLESAEAARARKRLSAQMTTRLRRHHDDPQ